jgi:trimeric autotransporter adhesin
MRRFVTLVVLLLFSIPFGVSLSGCSKNAAPVFCNGGDSGITTGQVTTITISPIVYGISLNYAQIGTVGTPTATDCKGATASVGNYTWGTTDMTIADIQPSTGRLCAGTWNRNSGGGIPDYTVCNPTNKSGTAYISASADGVTSNPLPIFVHPVVTSIVIGSPSTNCSTDPTTACCPLATSGAVTAPPYSANSCLSQGKTAQLVARVFAGTGANQTNISCLAGHLQFSAQGGTSTTSPVVTIDQNGVATANQPGSVLISANVANAASSAGYFSTCPPVSITLSTPGVSTNPAIVNQNNNLPLVATAVDANGTTLTGLALEYESTSPTTIPGGSGGSITPLLAGSALISATCQPPACNSASYNQIGLFGNGKPVTSNSVDVTAPGTNSTVLYMASTQSLYMVSRDFTQPAAGTPFLLPYVPNSMVITNDGSTIYLGSATALMVVNAVNNLGLSRTDTTSPGTVLAVSPDGSELVVTDPVRQITTLESSSGSVISTYGGVGTHAEFAPDSATVYITAGNQLLVYSNYTGWTSVSPATSGGTPVKDVAITSPAVGAYFAGSPTTARGYCPISTPLTATSESNVFYPPADSSPAITDRIAATNDGLHIIGASVTPVPTLSDLRVNIPSTNTGTTSVSIACPTVGGLTFSNTLSTTLLSPITATTITGVWPTSDSSLAFVTYTGSGGVVPAYAPAASGPGTATYVKLSGAAVAPVSGVVSADNTTFYVGTTGDNLVHLINRSTLTDSSTLTPNLTNPTGTVVPVDLLVQKPRKTT